MSRDCRIAADSFSFAKYSKIALNSTGHVGTSELASGSFSRTNAIFKFGDNLLVREEITSFNLPIRFFEISLELFVFSQVDVHCLTQNLVAINTAV